VSTLYALSDTADGTGCLEFGTAGATLTAIQFTCGLSTFAPDQLSITHQQEPASAMLFACGLAALAAKALRRNRA
jgi:hypothetical protein